MAKATPTIYFGTDRKGQPVRFVVRRLADRPGDNHVGYYVRITNAKYQLVEERKVIGQTKLKSLRRQVGRSLWGRDLGSRIEPKLGRKLTEEGRL